jgi:hypothetical protein
MNRWRGVLGKACLPSHGFLFLRVLLFAAAVPLLMRLKLTRLQRLLEPSGARRAADPAVAQALVSYVDAIAALGPPLARRKCLTRGLTLYYFLRRCGLDVALHFGVGTPEDDFVGHCWLVRDGEPFLESPDPRPLYVTVYGMPRPPTRREAPTE